MIDKPTFTAIIFTKDEAMNKTFKYRIYANQSTIQKMEQWISFCRHLYNLALEQRIYAWKNQQKSISKFEQMRQITQLRKTFPEYKEINANILHNVIKRLDKTYQNFFSRIKKGYKDGFPRFKGINRYDSITFRKGDGWKLDGKYISITKAGKFKIKLSRPIEGTIQEVTIKKTLTNKWFINFNCKDISEKIFPKSTKEIGIDVGCINIITDSNGNKIKAPHFFKQSQAKLAKHQQSLARKKIGSNRRKKAKYLIASAYEKITNQRRDFNFKLANELLTKNKRIFVEDIQSWNTEWRCLNKSLRDVAFFGFLEILSNSAEGANREVIQVPAKNTSQICSSCGEIVKKDLSVRIHQCSCGLTIDRDHNAALNILRLGQSRRTASSLIREYA